MPKDKTATIPLRVIVDQPIPGLALALQSGKDGLEPPAAVASDRIIFDFEVRVGPPRADGSLNLLGPYTQGPAAARFVYLCVGQRAGQAASPWNGRVKIPLTGITPAQITQVLASGHRLAVHIPARNSKGAPMLATVPLSPNPWTAVPDGPPKR